jgi:hypothetical protein
MTKNFRDCQWDVSYRTSRLKKDGKPTDILREFYIPALQIARTYDRVAGYFRSSSLAAASQGYTAFMEHDGKMRLIVGADLDLADVRAILKGDESRLSQALLKELENVDTIENEHIRDGVALLSYMVASGKLEIRVSIRKHAITGAPLPIDAPDDGYVHEKWFIMSDENGDHLYGSGSLNESKTALVINAENIDVNWDWEGGNDKQRVNNAIHDFEMWWNNKVPYMIIKKLPDAVKSRMVNISSHHKILREIDNTILSKQDDISAEEALKFAILRDAPLLPGGQYLGMYSAPVEPWPHQEIVSHRLIETWPYSYMMCDEVGLGKTIEAALAFRSLTLSGYIKRALIVAPASLTSQWQRELADKTMLSFARTTAVPQLKHEYIFPDEHTQVTTDLYSPQLNIISNGLVARKERLEALKSAKDYDIVLVDEAQYIRRKDPKFGVQKAPTYGRLYHTVHDILRKKAKCLWLATATPMQIAPIEVYDLFKLTNRVSVYKNDPTLSLIYFNIMGRLITHEEISIPEWHFIGQSFSQLEASDPYLWNFLQMTCINSWNRKVLRDLSITTKPPKKADLKNLPRPLFAASPLSRVMMRHTRQLLEIYRDKGSLKGSLAVRHILPLNIIKFTKAEKKFYAQLEDYCKELSRQIAKGNEDARQMMYFYLNFLQLRFASSLYAIQQTLIRRLKRVKQTLKIAKLTKDKNIDVSLIEQLTDSDTYGLTEDDVGELNLDEILKNRSKSDLEWEEKHLKSMLAHINSMKDEVPSKIDYLLRFLETRRINKTDRFKQTVLFTRFWDTLSNIHKYLQTRLPNMRVGIYSGKHATFYDSKTAKNVETTREDIKRLFIDGEIDLLLCTDAAAEGLNLQTADLLINFDMGWNPMKIEQRIGRIDRIGQVHKEIFVSNMCYLGSAEEKVYGRLTKRLLKANLVVGTQQISMLPVDPNEFRELENGTLTLEEVTKRAEERLKIQRQAIASMEMSAEDQYEMYSQMTRKMRSEKLPATLDNLWSALIGSKYLAQCGAKVENGTWISPADKSFPQIVGTINRNSQPAGSEFVTWGNAKIDALLNILSSSLKSYKNCIRRIAVKTCLGNEIIGFLVATTEGPVLVNNYESLTNIKVDVTANLSDEEIADAKVKVKNYADTVSKNLLKTFKVEQLNKSYSDLHSDLIETVAIELLSETLKQGNKNFWNAISEVAENAPKSITIAGTHYKNKEIALMFLVQTISQQTIIQISTPLLTCCIDYACREADSMKVKKTQLKTIDVINRIKRKRAR